MNFFRIRTTAMRSVVLTFLCLAIVSSTAWGQSYRWAHIQECTRNIQNRTRAFQNLQWGLLVSFANQYVNFCLDVAGSPEEQAIALSDEAIGLIRQGQFADAIPISQRCAMVKPDAAYCFTYLGDALLGLNRLSEARQAYLQAIRTGGYDNLNASAVRDAEKRLDQIREQIPDEPLTPVAPTLVAPIQVPTPAKKYGTGFFVSNEGHIITNNHVIEGCRTIAILPSERRLEVVGRKPSADLALLKDQSATTSFAVFRSGAAPRLGDSVVAFGFPLPGILSSHGNVSSGILSATSGPQDDVRLIQISAPVQSGNSGGPLFDSSGHVIGVVVAKLDAIQIARATGDVPQNVNFAVHWSEIRSFLEEEGIQYHKSLSQRGLSTSDIASLAVKVSVQLECTQ